MAGPGGNEVERISVKVVPDTDGFRKKLKAFLEKVEKESEVEVELKLNSLGFKQQLDQLTRDRTIEVSMDLDAAEFRRRLATVLRGRDVKVDVALDTSRAAARLARLTRPRTVHINVNYDRSAFEQMYHAMVRLQHVSRSLGQLANGSFRMIGNAGSAAFNGVGSAASGATQQVGSLGSAMSKMSTMIMLVLLPVIASLVAMLIGAIVGLVIIAGAAIGSLLMLVAPVAAVAAGIGWAFTGSSKAAKAFKKDILEVGKAAGHVLKVAVQPMASAIRKELPGLKKWVETLKGPLKSAFEGASRYVPELTAAVKAFVDRALFGLMQALNDRRLEAGIRGFRSFMDSLGIAFGRVFERLSANAPKFEKFFVAFGDSMAVLLPAIVDLMGAFAEVSPGVIQTLTATLVRLFQALSDPKTLDALSKFAQISFVGLLATIMTAIKWIELLIAAAQTMVTFFLNAWNTMRNAFNTFKGFFEGGIAGMASRAVGLVGMMVGQLILKFDSLTDKVGEIGLRLVRVFMAPLNRLASQAGAAARRVVSNAISAFRGLVPGADGILAGLIGVFESAWSRISGIVSRIMGAISNAKGAAASLGNVLGGLIGTFLVQPEMATTPALGVVGAGAFDPGGTASYKRTLKSLFEAPGTAGATTVQKVTNVTVNEAKHETTPQAVLKGLSYADALYGNA